MALEGGSGNDTFVFSKGADVVEDFVPDRHQHVEGSSRVDRLTLNLDINPKS